MYDLEKKFSPLLKQLIDQLNDKKYEMEANLKDANQRQVIFLAFCSSSSARNAEVNPLFCKYLLDYIW